MMPMSSLSAIAGLAAELHQNPTVPSPYLPAWTGWLWLVAGMLAVLVLFLFAMTTGRSAYGRYSRRRHPPTGVR